jgi:hypothetical protein
MINNSGIICNSKAAATAALETIAGTFSKGTQRDAIVAVINWIEENYPKDLDEEAKKRIMRVYEDLFDEGNQKALTWNAQGGEPPHGARVQVPYLFNADKKAWELEGGEMPPTWLPEADILPRCEYLDPEDTT